MSLIFWFPARLPTNNTCRRLAPSPASLPVFQLGHIQLHHLGAARGWGDARAVGPRVANIPGGGGPPVPDADHRPRPPPVLGWRARAAPLLHGVNRTRQAQCDLIRYKLGEEESVGAWHGSGQFGIRARGDGGLRVRLGLTLPLTKDES